MGDALGFLEIKISSQLQNKSKDLAVSMHVSVVFLHHVPNHSTIPLISSLKNGLKPYGKTRPERKSVSINLSLYRQTVLK